MATTNRGIAAGRHPKSKPTTDDSDPLNINFRLYGQIGKLLDDLEREDRDEVMTTPQRISALIAVGRILTIFAALKKNDYNYGNTGSKIREYSAAFSSQAHGVGSRAAHSRPDPVGFGGGDGGDEFDA